MGGTGATLEASDLSRYAAVLAVNADRAAVGLPPMTFDRFDSEFGWRNNLDAAREKLTFDFLSRKARHQLRNPKTQEFMEERGNLDLDIPGFGGGETSRAHIGTDPASGPDMDPFNWSDQVSPVKYTEARKIPRSPTVKVSPVTRLTGNDAITALQDAGFDPEITKRWAHRGVVFRVEEPGRRNPAFVFVAHADGMTQLKTLEERNAAEEAKERLALLKQELAGKVSLKSKVAAAQIELDKANAALAAREQVVRAVYGYGGNETIGKWEQGLAEEAGAALSADVEQWPPWKVVKNGNPLPIMLEFDESQLVKEGQNDIRKTDFAITHTGSDTLILTIDRTQYRRPSKSIEVISPGFMMPTEAESVGTRTIPHEGGHLQDGGTILNDKKQKVLHPWDSQNEVFDEFLTKLRGIVDSTYGNSGRKSPITGEARREQYAEMMALSRERPEFLTREQRVAVDAFRSVFMLMYQTRSEQPNQAWVNANLAWMEVVLAAGTGNASPLPNPSKFYEQPSKVTKPSGFKLPW